MFSTTVNSVNGAQRGQCEVGSGVNKVAPGFSRWERLTGQK